MSETEEEGFISFVCPSCRCEIEATLDLIGERTECPACGIRLVVPDTRTPALDADGVVRHGADTPSPAQAGAAKSRTIRIELGDLDI